MKSINKGQMKSQARNDPMIPVFCLVLHVDKT